MGEKIEIIALFDFDKTIVSKDSGYEFVRQQIQANAIRRALAIFVTPIALIFYFSPHFKVAIHSMYLWIATVGIGKNKIDKVKKDFIKRYLSKSGTIVYAKALEKLTYHLNEGHSVYIVSGAPTWILESVADKIGISGCTIIGSTETTALGGFIYRVNCYGYRKVNLLNNFINNNSHKIYGYTDSAADIPLLSICTHRYVVNPNKAHLKKFKKAFGNDFQILNWA